MSVKGNLDELKGALTALLAYANGVTGASDTSVGDAVHTIGTGYGGVTVPRNMLIGEFTPEDNVNTCTLTDSCPGTMVGYLLLAPGLEYAAHEGTGGHLFAAVGKTYMNRTTWQAPTTGVKPDGSNTYYSNNKVLAQSGSTIKYSYGTMALARDTRYVFVIIYE